VAAGAGCHGDVRVRLAGHGERLSFDGIGRLVCFPGFATFAPAVGGPQLTSR
jgi:hypothetical protein